MISSRFSFLQFVHRLIVLLKRLNIVAFVEVFKNLMSSYFIQIYTCTYINQHGRFCLCFDKLSMLVGSWTKKAQGGTLNLKDLFQWWKKMLKEVIDANICTLPSLDYICEL
jgi:hypothetical protein